MGENTSPFPCDVWNEEENSLSAVGGVRSREYYGVASHAGYGDRFLPFSSFYSIESMPDLFIYQLTQDARTLASLLSAQLPKKYIFPSFQLNIRNT